MLARLLCAHSPCVSMVSLRAHCVCSVSMRISVFALGVPLSAISVFASPRVLSVLAQFRCAASPCSRNLHTRTFHVGKASLHALSMLTLFTCAQSYCTHFHTVRHCPVPSHQFGVTLRNHNLSLRTSGPLSREKNGRK